MEFLFRKRTRSSGYSVRHVWDLIQNRFKI